MGGYIDARGAASARNERKRVEGSHTSQRAGLPAETLPGVYWASIDYSGFELEQEQLFAFVVYGQDCAVVASYEK